MRHLKALGLGALAIMAALVIAGSASATVLTSPAGTKVQTGTAIKIESESIQWDGSILPNCSKFNLEGNVNNAGGPEATVSGAVQKVEFWGCSTDTLIFIKTGNFELHETSGGNGTLTWTGAELTTIFHKMVGGFPVTTHCIYKTENTSVGTVTGSSTAKGTAQLDISAAFTPGSTDGSCGSLQFTGNAKFAAPDYLDIDKEVSGTTLTSSSGTTAIGAGAKIKAESEEAIKVDSTFPLSCAKSSIEAEIGNPGGAGTTVTAPVGTLTFAECGSDTVSVLKKGTLELHATAGGNGTMTWSGAEVTSLVHRILLGFPITAHCIYKTENTHVGTFTGSSATKGTAALDIGSATLLKVGTDTACGEEEPVLTGKYKFTSPDYIDTDVAASSGTTLTTLTSTTVEAGAKIKSESEGAVEFAGTITFNCQKSAFEGEISNAGGKETQVSGPLNSLSFSECGNHTVEVKKPGTLEIQALGSGKGTLTSTGAEITILTHGVFLGTRHCIYVTNKTDIGTITGSGLTGSTATLDIGPVITPQTVTDGNCGSNAEWGGSYKITSPDHLSVDQT